GKYNPHKGLIVVSEKTISNDLREHRDARQEKPIHPEEAWQRLDALKQIYAGATPEKTTKDSVFSLAASHEVKPHQGLNGSSTDATVVGTNGIRFPRNGDERKLSSVTVEDIGIVLTTPERVSASSVVPPNRASGSSSIVAGAGSDTLPAADVTRKGNDLMGRVEKEEIPFPGDPDRKTAFKKYLVSLRGAAIEDHQKLELAVAFLETQWLTGSDEQRRGYRGVSSSSGVSGMADVVKLLLLRNKNIQNPNIVLIRSAYGGTDANLDFYRSFGLDVRYVIDPDRELVGASDRNRANVLDENTVAVIFESPNNPPLRVWDIEKIVRTVKANAPRALTVFDGAFATPAGQQPLKFGVDIVVQVVTKMLGTGNAFGTVTVAREDLARQLEYVRSALIHPQDAKRILDESLPTFFERYQASLENARYFVDWLKGQDDVVKTVSYPGDIAHPQFYITEQQSEGENYGNMVYFDMNDLEAARLFVSILVFLRTTKHSVSLGEVRTQVQLPLAGAASTMPEEAKKKLSQMGMSFSGVRVSIGIEDPRDIIRDFKAAFDVVRLFKGREKDAPLEALRDILMHPTVQPDGKTVEYVTRLFPAVRKEAGSEKLIVEPRIERSIRELERRTGSLALKSVSLIGFRKVKRKYEDTLAALRIIHTATRVDRLAVRTLGVQSGILWNPLVNPYAVTPGGEESNAYIAEGPDSLKLGFSGPNEAGKAPEERGEDVVSGLYRVYGRIGTANALVVEKIVASAEGGIAEGLHEDVQGVSVPSLETAVNVLLESYALQAKSADRTGPVRVAVIANEGSSLYSAAKKFQDIYGGVFSLKGEQCVEFILIKPDKNGRVLVDLVHRDADLVVLDELSDHQDDQGRLFQSIKSKAVNTKLAVINSRGIKRGFMPLNLGADFTLDEFTDAYGEAVAAVIVTPRAWVTKLLARRTYTSIASRAAMLGILPTTFLGIPRADQAQIQKPLGGIDLDGSKLKINIRVDGAGIPLPVQFQDPAMINMHGLEPVIRSIMPMVPLNMPVLSELTTKSALSAG
ncbi:MAG: PLP-dependent transferase, partial [Candidatus Omnitrophota bacterium]